MFTVTGYRTNLHAIDEPSVTERQFELTNPLFSQYGREDSENM